MILESLKLHNFKGIRDFTLETGGADTNLFADNGVGKTTMYDAMIWLLFDKDSQNRKDFEIKTIGTDGEPFHNLDHEVTGEFDIDGKALTLRKVYTEDWTKVKGKVNKEFTGHTTKYYIDGVPNIKKKDYQSKITSIIDENVFKLLTNPRYFPEVLKWTDRRQLILSICGDVSDADVIESDKALAGLPAILKDRTLDNHRKVITERRTAINKELQTIPVRIDEANRALPEVSGSPTAIIGELAELKEERTKKANEISQLKSGGGVAQKQKQLAEVETALLKMEKEQWQANANQWQAIKVELQTLEDETRQLKSDIQFKTARIAGEDHEIKLLEKAMESLRKEWNEVDSRVFTFKASGICQSCGALPEHQVNNSEEKALAEFNLKNSTMKESITKDGKEAKSKVEERKATIKAIEQERDQMADTLIELEEQIAEKRAEVEAIDDQPTTEDPSYTTKQAEKDSILQEIETLKGDIADAVRGAIIELAAAESDIEDHEAIVAQHKNRESGLQRIEELKATEKKLGAEYENLEEELYLTEQFTRSKVALLEDRINSRFELARFKMFNVQVNGGIEECCEVLYNGIPYSSALNNGAQINVGLDIVNTLSEHYNFDAPIFVDNAEAVTQLIPTRGQQIRMYVSENDKVMRVENGGAVNMKLRKVMDNIDHRVQRDMFKQDEETEPVTN